MGDQFGTVTSALGAISACATVLWGGLRYGRKAIRAAQHYRNSLDLVEKIHATLTPNGGSSLADRICRIEDMVVMEQQRRRAVAIATGIPFWEADERGAVTYVSPRCAELVGLSPEEIRGNGWVTAVHWDDQERVYEAWTNAVQQRRQFRSAHRFYHRNGTVVHVDAHGMPLFSGSDLKGFIGVLAETSRTNQGG